MTVLAPAGSTVRTPGDGQRPTAARQLARADALRRGRRALAILSFPAEKMIAEPIVETRAKDDDGFRTAGALFGFYLACMGLAAYLYWHGAGKLPWQ